MQVIHIPNSFSLDMHHWASSKPYMDNASVLTLHRCASIHYNPHRKSLIDYNPVMSTMIIFSELHPLKIK